MSPRDLVLGIDVGTGGCKVCAVDRTGRGAAAAAESYPTHSPQPGWAEQDPDDWPVAIAGAVRRLLAEGPIDPSDVAGLALSSAAHVGVLVDEAGRPVRRAILWSDQRSVREAADLEESHGPEILRLSFQKVSTTWTLPHLLWVRRNEPDVWANVRRVLLSKDYVLHWLTGRAVTDPATALSSQLFDASRGEWSHTLCDLVGVRTGDLPEVVPAPAVAGGLGGEVARQLGLPSGLPVVVGTLDSAAETFGAGVVRPGQLLLRLATAGGIHLVLDAPLPHPQLITYPHPIAPLWYCQAGTSSCASAVQWAMTTFTAGRGMSYAEWGELAAGAPPGSEGLIFHPYLAGERCPHWDPHLRASFIGATMHHGPAHFARAVYEGTAFSIRDAFSTLADLPIDEGPLTAVGGGTASDLWLQIMSDVLARPIDVAAHADSSHGAALLGLVGLGLIPTMDQAAAIAARTAKRVIPIAANVKRCDRQFDLYRDIHRQLAPVTTAWASTHRST